MPKYIRASVLVAVIPKTESLNHPFASSVIVAETSVPVLIVPPVIVFADKSKIPLAPSNGLVALITANSPFVLPLAFI
jgi:hypothetical protein